MHIRDAPPLPELTWDHEANQPGVMQLFPIKQHQSLGIVQDFLHPEGKNRMSNWGENDNMNNETLRNVLLKVLDISWSLALYLPKNRVNWNLDTLAMIEDPDDVESDELDDDPEIIKEANYKYVLSIQMLQRIVTNAKLQKENVTEEDLLQCLIYYFNNDAYLTL